MYCFHRDIRLSPWHYLENPSFESWWIQMTKNTKHQNVPSLSIKYIERKPLVI